MKPIIFLLLLASAMPLAPLACSPQVEKEVGKAMLPPKSTPPKLAPASEPAPLREITVDEKAVVEGNNQFALDLYARLAKEEKGNIIFSPYSISNALAMTYAGARGETAEQMAKVLHFSLEQERLHPVFGGLMKQLDMDYPGRPYHLYIANRLWVQEKFPLTKRFLQINREDYRAGLKEVDFARNPEEGLQTINSWVEEKTKDKIKNLLLSGDVTSDTRLVLTNAIYFKANWKMRFPKDQTKEAPFEVAPGEKLLVPIMYHKKSDFKYFEDASFQWLELPYLGDRLSMLFLLPRNKGQLADLEKTLSAASVQKGIAKLWFQNGSVSIPRFKLTLRRPLKEDLEKLGMPLPFSEQADFNGIASGRRLIISGIFHKAYIDVDEEGTEAAAATGITITPLVLSGPFIFRADHPFLFLIREQQTGSILFLGRVSDPR